MKTLADQLENCPIVDGGRVVPLDLAKQIIAELRVFEDYVEVPYIDLADASAAKWIFGDKTMKGNDDAAEPEKPA